MPRPCQARHPEPQPETGCTFCRLYVGRADYRAYWDGERSKAKPQKAANPSAPCVHRGSVIVREEECKTCAGRVRLRVYSCGVHGECTIAKSIPNVHCCKSCPDYAKIANSAE